MRIKVIILLSLALFALGIDEGALALLLLELKN